MSHPLNPLRPRQFDGRPRLPEYLGASQRETLGEYEDRRGGRALVKPIVTGGGTSSTLPSSKCWEVGDTASTPIQPTSNPVARITVNDAQNVGVVWEWSKELGAKRNFISATLRQIAVDAGTAAGLLDGHGSIVMVLWQFPDLVLTPATTWADVWVTAEKHAIILTNIYAGPQTTWPGPPPGYPPAGDFGTPELTTFSGDNFCIQSDLELLPDVKAVGAVLSLRIGSVDYRAVGVGQAQVTASGVATSTPWALQT